MGPNTLLNWSYRNNAWQLAQNTINENWFKNSYNKSTRHYIMVRGSELIGFALMGNNKNKDVKIRLISTKSGHGFGRNLMERIINNARNRNLSTISLYSVPEARGFYLKLGFVPIGKSKMRYYLSSRKKLASPASKTPRR